jgi:hypothetical protein
MAASRWSTTWQTGLRGGERVPLDELAAPLPRRRDSPYTPSMSPGSRPTPAASTRSAPTNEPACSAGRARRAHYRERLPLLPCGDPPAAPPTATTSSSSVHSTAMAEGRAHRARERRLSVYCLTADAHTRGTRSTCTSAAASAAAAAAPVLAGAAPLRPRRAPRGPEAGHARRSRSPSTWAVRVRRHWNRDATIVYPA